jgi:hypothetical protein
VTGSAQFTGKAQFSRSGVATVAGTALAPANSVQVSLPITRKTMMTATLQKFVAGCPWWPPCRTWPARA